MTLKKSLLIGLLGTSTVTGAWADFSASTPINDDSALSTVGTEVFGGTANNGGPYTLANGVIFNTQLINEGHYGPPGYDPYVASGFSGSTVEVNQDGAGYGDQTGSTGLSDSALNAAVGNNFATEGALNLWVEGLTPGQDYLVQVLAALTQSGNINGAGTYSATETVQDLINGGSTTLNYGQTYDNGSYIGTGAYLVTETFTANSAGTAEIYISGSSNDVDLDAAIQIREVPEPSAYALAGLGMGALFLFGRSLRRSSAL